MSIKSLTDPTGDLTIYCKEVINADQPDSTQIQDVISVEPGGTGTFALTSSSNSIIQYTRLDSKNILRTISSYITGNCTAPGTVIFKATFSDDNLPLSYSASGITRQVSTAPYTAWVNFGIATSRTESGCTVEMLATSTNQILSVEFKDILTTP